MRRLGLLMAMAACGVTARTPAGGTTGAPSELPDLAAPVAPDLAEPPLPSPVVDAGPFDPDAACITASETAQVEYLPVDIIWMVDNSVSMKPAVDAVAQGLNTFASQVAMKSFDYKIIMLSLRSQTNPVTVGGKERYAVCIPPPLSGDNQCGNGARFFQSSVDVKSTQPLEQLLGTLGQTDGYKLGEERGGEPWRDQLRDGATRTIVLVSDDNARLSADDFEHFAGGKNPFNTLQLPPGILDASWGGLFDDYTFDAVYGWGSPTDPNAMCSYPNGTKPPSAGPTYTELVTRTKGVRAHICDPASSWTTFLDTVAQAVAQTAKLTCALAIPAPPAGTTLDPAAINVSVDDDNGAALVFKVADAAACGSSGGWYYDSDTMPTQVLLCPASCTYAQDRVENAHGKIDVHFGCSTIVK